MAKQALLPTFRLSFPYTVNSMAHVFHLYLRTAASADPSGYNTVPRPGSGAVGVSTVTSVVWTAIKTNYKSTETTFGNAHLDQLVSGSWVPIWYETNAVTPTAGGTAAPASLMTLSGYTTSHEKFKLTLMELYLTIPYRWTSRASAPSSLQSILDQFFNANSTATDTSPWAWVVDRDNTYLSTWISVVGALSKHWRRKRNLG